MLVQGWIYKYLIHLLLQQEKNSVLIRYFIIKISFWLKAKKIEKNFNMSNILLNQWFSTFIVKQSLAGFFFFFLIIDTGTPQSLVIID